MKPLRIGIAGIAIESSTFSPHRTRLPDFTVTRGDALLARYSWIGAPWCADVEWVPLLHAVSLPGGAVEPSVYDALEAEIVERAKAAGPLDGLFFDIHGAMSVVGRTDAEAGLALAVRSAVGPDTLISTSMDLHGNVSRSLAETVDLITCYRMAPHEDAWESRERAAYNLVERLRDGGRPLKAWVQVPVLLPGEKTSTRIEPARSLYGRIPRVEGLPGVLDAAIWVGYAWADEPRCRAAVVVTGDDEDVITAQARELASVYWRSRTDFAFVAPTGTLDECLSTALASPSRPFLISDSGDNPTAGGAGDVSWTLGRLLGVEDLRLGRVNAIYASVVDPAAVTEAFAAGTGAELLLHVGGRIDPGPSGPVALAGTVHALHAGDAVGGDIAVIRTGGLHVILTSRRKPYHLIADFTGLGLSPATADIVIVKIGYLEPELYDLAADWRLALTPGGVDQDLLRLGHHGVRRPLFPFDTDMPEPDLTPELL
ncbi:M81 family metallopeptidase [Actinomadura sp. DC4]|uniref:M81 family metallopeptidase n=1 Tax=Actinomadura sp. DC4 TaxID=3055069 RepID=UPI0025AED211|nr:M81 family metallopeptidase [Actinomadura sp. DC4]MDN3355585.1 M81 family metallopeptidase [Actinomadura sp. DC4]